MIDAIRFFIGLQLMLNGFVASVHLMFIAMGVQDQFKRKAYVISSIVATICFFLVMMLPLLDKFFMWIKS